MKPPWWRSKWVVLWSLWAARVVRQPTPPVLTSSGWVRGSVANAGTHKEYLAIPYATVVNRFQKPGPEPTWTDTFEAVDQHIRCRQVMHLDATITMGQEDCLALNVYTPLDTPPGTLLPVMFYIHGGAFIMGSGSRMVYGPEFLVEKDVILVTINYRLYVQGFTSLGIKEAPGNSAMKDQVAALKWVQRNIKAFGGDPDNVTIFGESAGAISVSLHVLSAMSKGLFHKAITQSGSSLISVGFQYEPVYTASLLAKVMGFNSTDANALYKFFMTKSAVDMVIAKVPRLKGNTLLSEVIFSPSAEKEIEGEEPFLNALPYDILANGNYNKVPMIIGYNSEEGLLFTRLEKDHFVENMAVEKSLPRDLAFPSNETKKLVVQKIKELYFGNEEISLENKVKLAKMVGEQNFVYPVIQETELLMRTSDQPIYSYNFAYDGLRNILKLILSKDLKSASGATHADELCYLFSQPILPAIFGMEMVEKMTTMWTNFAKYGDPTPAKTELLPTRWPAITKEDPRSLLIDDQLSTIPLWHSETLRYWKEVYSKYRRKLNTSLDLIRI